MLFALRDWGRLLLSLQEDQAASKTALLDCANTMQAGKSLWKCNPKEPATTPEINFPSIALINFVKHVENYNNPLQVQLQRELAANQLDASLAWIEQQLNRNPKSEDTLRVASLLAQRQGNKQLARAWGERLVQLKPMDVDLLKQQINYELAIPDLPKALTYAQRWQAIATDSIEAHSKTADIALWAGDAETSLTELLWLFQRTNSTDYLQKSTKLASALQAQFDRGIFCQDRQYAPIDGRGSRDLVYGVAKQ